MKKIFKTIVIQILEWEARLVIWRFKPKIAAVTGSVGKTTTKDALATALGVFFKVRKSKKSFNSETGIPLTILGLDTGWNNISLWLLNIFKGITVLFYREYPEWLVLEVGADRPGDIERITRWLKPDIAVVSQMSKVPVHIEFFNSQKDVLREKGFLVKATKKDGIVVLNYDDEDVLAMKEFSKSKTFTFGFDEKADVVISNEKIDYEDMPIGMSAKINYEGNSVPIHIKGALGHQQLYPVAASLAAIAGIGRNLVDAGQAFDNHSVPPGRMRIIKGLKGSVIIDDSYNSSPIALTSALFTLKSLEYGSRKIAVLGDMLELGSHTTEEHKKAGARVASFCDLLFTVGVRAKYIADGARKKGMDDDKIFEFNDAQKAGKELEGMLEEGDVVLIKGSQGSGSNKIRMESAVKEIMAEPEKAGELLVRQEEEWEER